MSPVTREISSPTTEPVAEPRFTRPGYTRVARGTPPRTPFRRPRHHLPVLLRPLLRPFFRYSYWRDAWVLRLVGNRHGPVFTDLRVR